MPFSNRTAWPLEPNAFSVALEAARRRSDFIDLTTSNPTAVGLSYPEDELRRALAAPEVLRYRPDPFGAATAREAVAAYYERRGIAVDPSRIALVASTSQAYSHLFALLADPGDGVLVPRPSYPLFGHLADLADVRLLPYDLAYDGAWYVDRSTLAADARAIVVVLPNNPTGSLLDGEERRLVANRSLPIISDEVFADFLFAGSHRDASLIGSADGLTFSLNGLSKSAGLPQMKVGWIAISGDATRCAAARARLEVVLDAYLSVSGPAQAVLPTALALADAWQEALRDRLGQNVAALDRLLAGSPLGRRHAVGGWTALVDLPALDSDEGWCLAFLEEGVATHPGYLYDLSGRPVFAVSLIVEPGRLEEGVSRIVHVVNGR